MKIPELDLELAGGTLGGMVTTVEGLVTQIRESEYSSFNIIFCPRLNHFLSGPSIVEHTIA